jgi:hypothetical protein
VASMRQYAAHQRTPLFLFAGVVVGVYATALALVSQLPHLGHARAVSLGLTVDMVVVVPLMFYILVVRPRGLPLVSLAPVLILAALAASRILPADHQQPLRVLEAVVVPIELGLIGWIAWRAASALRKAQREEAGDPLEQLRRAALELIRNDRAAAVLASEVAVFYYAFASWRARPHAPAGSSAHTHHIRSGHAGIVLALLLVLAAEGLAVHVLLLKWSAVIAWMFTIGSAYGALWLIADYRATVLRPILVSDESILVRAGLRCTLHVPRAWIADVGRKKPEFGKEILDLTFLGAPTRWLTLSEPMLAQGPYGFRRRVRAIGIEPDTPEEFDRVFAERL